MNLLMSTENYGEYARYAGSKTNVSRKTVLQEFGYSNSESRIVHYKNSNNMIVFIDYVDDDKKYDLWENGVVLHLRGSGRYSKKNDVENMTLNDEVLYNLDRNGVVVHLFWSENQQKYRYGQVLLRQNIPYQVEESDENGVKTYIWIFPLIPSIAYKMDEKYSFIKERYIEKKNSEDIFQNMLEDIKLSEEINNMDLGSENETFEYLGKARKKVDATVIDGVKVYNRDKRRAMNALIHSNFSCEIDIDHKSFISRCTKRKYMEPHHLVPIAYSDGFEVSLDIEENIVSLCSNCHNQIHYGEDARELIEKLYEERKTLLKSVGIDISLKELIQMYELI